MVRVCSIHFFIFFEMREKCEFPNPITIHFINIVLFHVTSLYSKIWSTLCNLEGLLTLQNYSLNFTKWWIHYNIQEELFKFGNYSGKTKSEILKLRGKKRVLIVVRIWYFSSCGILFQATHNLYLRLAAIRTSWGIFLSLLPMMSQTRSMGERLEYLGGLGCNTGLSI